MEERTSGQTKFEFDSVRIVGFNDVRLGVWVAQIY
jgi:hypothetical protein